VSEAKKENSFFDNLNFIQKNLNPKIKITDDLRTKLDATNFPCRYLLDGYLSTNPNLASYINKYINKDYTLFYKLAVSEAVDILREYNLTNPLYNPIFKKKEKDDFNDRFKTLRESFQSGLGKPELEIFMMTADKLPEEERSQIFKVTKTDIKKSAKTTHKEVEEARVIKYASYKEYLLKLLSLKESPACEKCKLKSNNSVYFETNMKYGEDDHANILILSDQPSDGMIMRPDSYKILEQFIKHYKFDSLKYIISNVVLCESPTKITKCESDVCYNQIDALINVTKPDVILALGSNVCDRLGIDPSGIVTKAGVKVSYKGYDVIISVHPSYLIKNQNQDAYQVFGTAFQEVYNVLFPPDDLEILNNGRKRPGDVISSGKIYGAKVLPQKFYTSDWVLIDIHKDGFKTIDHTFRNVVTNEKVIKKIPTSHYEYYYIMKNINDVSKPFLNARDVICKKGPWKFSPDADIIEKLGKTILYEGTTELGTKAATDYYYFTQPESDYLPQVFRYDIEHDIENFHGTDLSAPYKVTYISAEFNGDYYLWILDSEKVNIGEISKYKTHKGKEVKLTINEFAGDESLLLQHFWYTFFTLDPDVMTAWFNHNFDYPYMINRAKRVAYKKNPNYYFANFDGCVNVIDMFQMMGKTYNVKIEGDEWGHHSLSGIIIADSMVLFEQQWQNSVESNSLDFVSHLVLDLGKKPFPKKGASREEWIEYNLWDTELMVMIDEKLQNTNYKFSLMKITTNTWDAIDFALGIVEGLSLYHWKKNNHVLRTSRDSRVFPPKFLTSLVGGFTQNSKVGGLYRMLVDYDGASMYPSIMNTFNIGPNTLRMTVTPEVAKQLMMNKDLDPNQKVQVAWREMESVRGLQYEDSFMMITDVRKMIDDNKYIVTPSGAIFCSIEEEKSLFFDILDDLGSRRKFNKDSMYDSGSLDISKYNKQLALKISANAFFGVYLFAKFMFFNTSVGGAITMTGRFFIKCIMYLIEKHYGHVDLTLEQIAEVVDVLKVQDLDWFKMCFYADTDGTVITLQDIIPDEGSLDEQLEKVEKELKIINPYIAQSVDQLYKFFNKGQDFRLMKFKEDWVADKGLYYNKHKCYAIHLVREGGKKKDELLFRGIQVRRSDSPKIVKDELSNILNILLASKNKISIQDIFDYIEKTEEKFYKLCKESSMALGKPVKYGKADHQYKKRPWQVEAMMFWNALHKRNDFTVGSKGYYFTVQYIDYDYIMKHFGLTEDEIQNIKNTYETKAIAIPQDMAKVPEYLEIDANETVKKVFVTPYENILEPIMQETVISDIPLIDFL